MDFDVKKNEEVGGWFNASIYSVDEIVAGPDFLTNANARTVIFEQSNDVVDFLPIGEDFQIDVKLKKTKSGTVYQIKASFEMAMQSEEIDTYFNNFLNKKVVIIGVQWSGRKRLYGSKKFPLEFSYEDINGNKMEDGNRMKVTVSGEIPQKPVYIASSDDQNNDDDNDFEPE